MTTSVSGYSPKPSQSQPAVIESPMRRMDLMSPAAIILARRPLPRESAVVVAGVVVAVVVVEVVGVAVAPWEAEPADCEGAGASGPPGWLSRTKAATPPASRTSVAVRAMVARRAVLFSDMGPAFRCGARRRDVCPTSLAQEAGAARGDRA